MDYSPPDSSAHGISWARVLEWDFLGKSPGVGFPGQESWSGISWARVLEWDFLGKSTGVGFPGQEYWSGISWARVLEWDFLARVLEWLPFPSPWDHPDPGAEPASLALAGRFSASEPPGKFVLASNYSFFLI